MLLAPVSRNDFTMRRQQLEVKKTLFRLTALCYATTYRNKPIIFLLFLLLDPFFALKMLQLLRLRFLLPAKKRKKRHFCFQPPSKEIPRASFPKLRSNLSPHRSFRFRQTPLSQRSGRRADLGEETGGGSERASPQRSLSAAAQRISA